MTTHVFIVDANTFKYHLEYMFAGTGSKDNTIDFNNQIESSLYASTENNLVGMIADSQRVRVGDYVIFYLQQDFQKKIFDGKFYGIFKIKEVPSFLDNLYHLSKQVTLIGAYNFKYPSKTPIFSIKKNQQIHNINIKTALSENQEKNLLKKFRDDDKENIKFILNDFYQNNQYLLKKLEKSLTFRTIIVPYQVYAKGVTEWEALDEIKHIHSPNQMLWSLIYRKLKGNRGNTMITIYESERLRNLIRNKNKRLTLSASNLTFNESSEEIEPSVSVHNYSGYRESIKILPRLIGKYQTEKQFETHLQAYILHIIEDLSIFQNEKFEWIGNEVSCGVGMQRIDIMLSIKKNDDDRKVIPIELKSTLATNGITNQLQRYINWLEQYYIPNRPSDIEPMIISRKITDKSSSPYQNLIKEFEDFNKTNNIFKLRYVEFSIDNNKQTIYFNEIKY